MGNLVVHAAASLGELPVVLLVACLVAYLVVLSAAFLVELLVAPKAVLLVAFLVELPVVLSAAFLAEPLVDPEAVLLAASLAKLLVDRVGASQVVLLEDLVVAFQEAPYLER